MYMFQIVPIYTLKTDQHTTVLKMYTEEPKNFLVAFIK